MKKFELDDQVLIQCDIGPGAFPTEFLVTFETIEGPISGFVRRENVIRSDKGDVGYINGIVKEVTDTVITVLVKGSFFTTTGIAALERDWANTHVKVAHAA
jgi:hypothetical protein